jgi:subtilisin
MTKACCRIVILLLRISAIYLLSGCGGSSPAVSPAVQPGPAQLVTPLAAGEQRVIVTFKAAPGNAEHDFVRGLGGKVRHSHHIIPAIAATLSTQSVAQLRADARVKSVEPDGVVQACAVTIPWGVDRVQAPLVQAAGNAGAGVKVAILDTGIDYKHPNLAPNYKGGYDFVNLDADPMDDYGHGTLCAGIAAAANTGSGVVGVAPGVDLYAVKVLDAYGSGYASSIIAGLQWCVDNHIQVASMSLGGSTDSAALHSACDAAANAGVTLVAAAGNNGAGADTVDYPAKYSSVIAVGATDSKNALASFSSTGPGVALCAPGVGIYSTWVGGGYVNRDGTSAACPHVAGSAALVIKAGFTSPAAVRSRLVAAALDLGAPGVDAQYGYGLDQTASAAGVVVPPPSTLVHDVAVTKLTFVGSLAVGKTIALKVTVANLGAATEATTLTLADKTVGAVLGSVPVTFAAGATTTVSLPWVPATKGSHALSAAASTVAGETSVANNTRCATFKIN